MKNYLVLIFSFCFLLSNAQDNDWAWGGPLDPSQAAFDVRHITLNLEADPEEKTIDGFAEIDIDIVSAIDHIKLDLIQGYTVSSTSVNGEQAEFTRNGDILNVQLESEMDPGQKITVRVHYNGLTPIAVRPPWQGGFTYEKDANGKHWVGMSSQNEGAKIFMPTKDHPSDEADQGVDLIISVPPAYKVAANGLLLSETESEDAVTFHWSTDYSINNYGINWTIGDFVEKTRNYTTVNSNKVPMVMYLLRQNESQLTPLMDILETSVRTQEISFGEYPFWKEKIGIVETPYLGMEHQTINGYGNEFRYSKVGDTLYDTLLYHELGHEWWGNKVGVSDWADFWIQEGLCSYGDWLFYDVHAGREAYLKHVQRARNGINNETPIIVKENATSDEAYHSDIYTKGAFIIHSLRYVLGDEVFFETLKGFLNDPDYTYTNQIKTEDFQNYIKETTGFDAEPFFDLFLRTVKVPEIVVKKLDEKSYSIEITNLDFSLPMDVRMADKVERLKLSSEPTIVETVGRPVIDEEGWFLKKVIYE